MLAENAQMYKDEIKQIFDKKFKEDNFFPDDLVLTWDAHRDEKLKHGKFDHLWL